MTRALRTGRSQMNINSKIALALLLGVFSFFLVFLLGEGAGLAAVVPAAAYAHAIVFIGGVGTYFLVTSYLLLRGNPHAVREGWPVLMALNAALLVATLIAWLIEPNRGAVLATAGTALLAVVSSLAGAALASRAART